ALRHALTIDTYDMYCGHASTLVAVDIEATAKAFLALFKSRELRLQMGAAGRERAVKVYDWATIIPQYESLWAELKEIRHSQAGDQKPVAHPWPARLDPFYAFASYPTQTLLPETVLQLVDSDASTAIARVTQYQSLAMVIYASQVLPTETELQAILAGLATSPQAAGTLIAVIASERQAFVFRALVWLVKLGVLKVC
ncbi:MAG: hypothetical protein WD772_12955, partial [Pseudohongiellaceae bacterium]